MTNPPPAPLDLSLVVTRVPRDIIALGTIGTCAATIYGGLPYAVAFLIGAAAAYLNFRFIERLVKTIVRTAIEKPAKHPKLRGLKVFIQLALFILGAFVILHFSGFNLGVAFLGFLVCPAAVLLESIYYLLITYGHS